MSDYVSLHPDADELSTTQIKLLSPTEVLPSSSAVTIQMNPLPAPSPAINIPLYDPATIASTLLNVFGSPAPPLLDGSHLNLSKLRDADRSIWKRKGIQHLLNRIRKLRAAFVTDLTKTSDPEPLLLLCEDFSRGIDNWLKTLERAVLKQLDVTRRVRKATALELTHRREGLLYKRALLELGATASLGGLLRLRRALKELWYILHIADW